MVKWKDVVGYETLYRISDQGQVMRIKDGRWGTPLRRILKQYINGGGYATLHLCKHGTPRGVRVHQLVAEAFIGPRDGLHVNHKNGIKLDNRSQNLEYLSKQDNDAHAHYVLNVITPTRARGEKSGRARLAKDQVLDIRRKYAAHKTSYPKLAREYTVAKSTIQAIIERKSWTHI